MTWGDLLPRERERERENGLLRAGSRAAFTARQPAASNPSSSAGAARATNSAIGIAIMTFVLPNRSSLGVDTRERERSSQNSTTLRIIQRRRKRTSQKLGRNLFLQKAARDRSIDRSVRLSLTLSHSPSLCFWRPRAFRPSFYHLSKRRTLAESSRRERERERINDEKERARFFSSLSLSLSFSSSSPHTKRKPQQCAGSIAARAARHRRRASVGRRTQIRSCPGTCARGRINIETAAPPVQNTESCVSGRRAGVARPPHLHLDDIVVLLKQRTVDGVHNGHIFILLYGRRWPFAFRWATAAFRFEMGESGGGRPITEREWLFSLTWETGANNSASLAKDIPSSVREHFDLESL